MGSNLPQHLQELVDDMDEDYEHVDRIYLLGDRLIFRKPEKGEKADKRPCRYWRRATGEEVKVEFYPTSSKTGKKIGILTTTFDNDTGPVILGRAPGHAQKHFKVWHGTIQGFGSDNDNTDLVVKDLDEPNWLDKFRQDGSHQGSPGAKLQEMQTGSEPDANYGDDDDDNATLEDIDYEESDQNLLSQRMTRSQSRLNHRASHSSQLWADSSIEGDNAASEKEEPTGHTPEPIAPQAESPANLAHGRSKGSLQKTRLVGTTKSTRTTTNNDTSMLAPASQDVLRTTDSVDAYSSALDDLVIHFRPNNPKRKAESSRWGVCNTVSRLQSHAWVNGILREDDIMSALLVVVVNGEDGSIENFVIAKDDEDKFEMLQFGIQQIAKDGGLDRTIVEVRRFKDTAV